jgi:hypothetical protein
MTFRCPRCSSRCWLGWRASCQPAKAGRSNINGPARMVFDDNGHLWQQLPSETTTGSVTVRAPIAPAPAGRDPMTVNPLAVGGSIRGGLPEAVMFARLCHVRRSRECTASSGRVGSSGTPPLSVSRTYESGGAVPGVAARTEPRSAVRMLVQETGHPEVTVRYWIRRCSDLGMRPGSGPAPATMAS